MNSKRMLVFLIIGLLSSCTSDTVEISKPTSNSNEQVGSVEPLVLETIIQPDGLELFIKNMSASNYIIDTTRIKQTIWDAMGKHPTSEHNGHLIIEVPFPVKAFQKHFSNPKSYFFAHWNEEEKTLKNGNDYLLMTWNVDSLGISKEEEIYHSLHEFMGNFPSYVFRSEDTVYAMCHRLTVMAKQTRELTEELRDCVDSSAVIHRPFGGNEPR